jgi:phospholipid/cholesterol/gamma-HCH transport system ATP-binding protein
MIEYRNVHKAFDAPVLQGVNLTVASGEIVGIVGRSGGGKSVLLKTTNGLVLPDGGDVRIDGSSIYYGPSGTLERVRRTIGYVFQYAALFDSMNVFENVALGIPEDEYRGIDQRERVRRVSGVLRQVHLAPEHILGKLPSELSGGMRKRVGIARAVIGQPCIMLYDEPVTGLDPVTAEAVDRLIGQLARDLGATSVVVTHDIHGAMDLCDRIALLARGRIRFVGTPAEFRSCDDRLVRAFVDRRAAASETIEEEP